MNIPVITLVFICVLKRAEKGLLILAAGKDLYKKVNVTELIKTSNNENDFAPWFAEKVASHPHLTKRIAEIHRLHTINAVKAATTINHVMPAERADQQELHQ